MGKIIVLAGGSSGERAVSLRSGAAVAAQLENNQHDVTILDPASGMEKLKEKIVAADAVFPILHGLGGEDGTLQALLEDWHVPYVGSDAKASALCFDKKGLKALLAGYGILSPRGELVTKKNFAKSQLLSQPFVLKPYDGGSSVDTMIVHAHSQFDIEQADDIFAKHNTMLLEELIVGTEITVGVLGSEALPVVEIIPPTTGVFDYENKYNGKTQELCPPKNVRKPQQRAAQSIALEAHRIAGCRDLSRSDFIISAQGEIYFLETNTLPGMTEQSLFPKAAAADGIAMSVLVERLIQFALGRSR